MNAPALCSMVTGKVKRILHGRSGFPCAAQVGRILLRGLGAPSRARANLSALRDAHSSGAAVRAVFREEARPRRRFLVIVERRGSNR